MQDTALSFWSWLSTWISVHFSLWTFIGFFGQSLFMMRFVVQWIASEKAKQSIVPEIFWYFSLGGGLIVFVYALHQEDPVFIAGQFLGIFIYLRNLYFVWKNKKASHVPNAR